MTRFRLYLTILLLCIFRSLYAHGPIQPQIEYIRNQGQWHPAVQYKADLYGGTVYLEDNRLTFLFTDKNSIHPGVSEIEQSGKKRSKNGKENPARLDFEPDLTVRGHVYYLSWPGSRTGIQKEQLRPFRQYYNYFLGSDPGKWASKVPAFEEVVYKEIYPGIDFKVYSQGNIMKSDYILQAGVNPNLLRIRYEGVDSLFVDQHGDLIIRTSINTVTEHKPYAYQIIAGREIPVACSYRLENGDLLFDLSEQYRQDLPLIIDPTLVFSTYSGSRSDNWGASATHDSRGNMFLGGIALGAEYPTTPGAFQTIFGGGGFGLSIQTDVAIAKFSSDGRTMLYSTFLGGSANDVLASLFCSPQDELVALITTGSSDFPVTLNGFDRSFNGGFNVGFFQNSVRFPEGTDLAVVKLNQDGTDLVGSTYFGGRANDGANVSNALLFNYGDESRGDIALDAAGNIYIASNTWSNNIPIVPGSAQTRLGGDMDGLVASFSPDLSQLRWATYVGGSRDDAIYGIQIDRQSQIFVCGGTTSLNFPGTQFGLNSTYRGGFADGFVLRLDINGQFFTGGSYIGTSAYDQAYMIDLDRSGGVYLFGQSLGVYPTTPDVFRVTNGRQFIHKLSNDLRSTAFATTFGSTSGSGQVNIVPTSFLVDVCENIYAVGWGGTSNNGFQPLAGFTRNMPVTDDAFQRITDGSDFYLINLSKDARDLIYATYIGEQGNRGDHVDGGTSRFDKFGVVYQAVCASCGGTSGFPTTFGAHSRLNGSGNCNMAGIKFRFDLQAMLLIDVAADPPFGCLPFTTQFNYTSSQPARSYRWTFGDGRSSTEQFPSHTYNAPGAYRVKLIIEDPQNCNPIDSMEFTVNVYEFLSTDTVVNLCAGERFDYENRTFNQTGIYILDSLEGSFGCDSLIFLDLTIHPNYSIDTTLSFCGLEQFETEGRVFTEPGTYVLALQSQFGCDSLINLTLIDSPVPDPSIEGNLIFCPGDSTILDVISPPHRFRWSDGRESQRLVVVAPGVYAVTVTTEFGCTGTASVQVNQHPPAEPRVGITQNLDCVVLEVTLGQEPSLLGNYFWSGPDITDANRNDPFPVVTQPGTYYLTHENEFGCRATDSVLITFTRTFPFPELRVQPPCVGELNGTIDIVRMRGGTAPFRFTIANTPYNNVPSGPFNSLAPGTYDLFVIDADGCTSETSVTIPVAESIEIDLIKEVILRHGSSYQIKPELTIPPGVRVERVEWVPPIWLSCTDCLEPITTPDDSILYKITVIDDNGCMVMDSIYIRVFKPANIFIPSAFTPNRDGINDVFMIFSDPSVKGINEFKIFDRWGELVHERYDFQPNDPLFGWDGRFRGKEMNPAVFVYYVVAELFVGEVVILSGDVTLVR